MACVPGGRVERRHREDGAGALARFSLSAAALALASAGLLSLPSVAGATPASPAPLSTERQVETAAQDGPRWAARGSVLAVERRRASGPVVELIDTKTRRRTEVRGFGPAIGGQGRFVAVRRLTERGPRVVVCELATGRELVLPGLSVKGQPIRWSPDKPRLLVTLLVSEAGQPAEAGSPDLFLLDLAGAAPELLQITKDGGGGGRWLGGDRVIYEVPNGSGGTEILMRDRGGKGSPHRFWSDEPYGPPDPSRIS